jgi:hypothetical protein
MGTAMDEVMSGSRPTLRVIDGLVARNARPEKIALSLVHPSARIDVPARAIHWIEACEEFSFFVNKQLYSYPGPHVAISVHADAAVLIHRLTQKVVGDFIEIIVNGESVCKPRIVQAISRGRLIIRASDFDVAQELAAKMRSRCDLARPRLVGE